jgi:uncharacterized membrane protein
MNAALVRMILTLRVPRTTGTLGVYIGGLIIAGAFTFYPGRLMYRLFFE